MRTAPVARTGHAFLGGWLLLSLWLVPLPVHAQVCAGMADKALVAMSYETVTVGATVTVLTSARYLTTELWAVMAQLGVEDASLRFTVDGTPPTTTVGQLVPAGTVVAICGLTDIQNFRAIRTAGTNAKLTVHYFRTY